MSEEKKDYSFTGLGVSGIYVDEDGNMVYPFMMEDQDVQTEITDKTYPLYWRDHYEPGYCGPDREDYMETMAARAKADKEQKEIDYQGLHPQFSGISKKGRSLVFQGIVDHYGHMVITNENYSHISHFRHGLAMAQDKTTKKWGFVDRRGNEVILNT